MSIFACRAAEEDDEEWGWGDEEDDVDDIELTPSYNFDSNLHNRRPSNENNAFYKKSSAALPKKSPMRPATSLTRAPANATIDMPYLPSAQQSPLPKAAVSGLSIKKATPISKLHGSRAPAPASAGAPSTANLIPLPNSIGGAPLQITSLGQKQPVTAPPKKPHAPPPEDDIFASMGLSAKPTFTHNTAQAKPVTKASSSRWNTTPPAPVTSPIMSPQGFSQSTVRSNSTPFGSTLGGMGSLDTMLPTANTFAATSLKPSSSGGGNDEDWGDDADLDDLLDD